jgi:hypothetical protein
MKDDTTNTDARKTVSRLARRSLIRLGRRIFEADDRLAFQVGWEITQRGGGLGRSYRDPRFNTLTECTECQGNGVNAAYLPCSKCHATGRITISAAEVESVHRRRP